MNSVDVLCTWHVFKPMALVDGIGPEVSANWWILKGKVEISASQYSEFFWVHGSDRIAISPKHCFCCLFNQHQVI